MASILSGFEILGILAFAVSGMLTARRRRMDLVGVYTAAFVTAFGGGTVRDLLLDRRPFFWVQQSSYAIIIFVLAAASFLLVDARHGRVIERIILLPDALGLGLFAATGVAYGVQAQLPPFLAVMMGVITATFGGVLRDVLCNDVPQVFQQTQLYATCAFVGAWLFLLVVWLGGNQPAALLNCLGATFVLRLAAVRFDLKLPA